MLNQNILMRQQISGFKPQLESVTKHKTRKKRILISKSLNDGGITFHVINKASNVSRPVEKSGGGIEPSE